MQYGLIGEHLPHSFSGIIHGLIGEYEGLRRDEYTYELKELAYEDVGAFLKAADFKGINVTIPYKETVLPYLDKVDDAAARIGAVNTIVNRAGRLYGYNTDYFGLRDLILHIGIELAGMKVLILGTGGTSKTARCVCTSLGAASIYVVSRNPVSCDDTDDNITYISYDEAYKLHSDAKIIINTTPVGMYPKAGASPIDISSFKELSGVIDVIYNPLRTGLILDAKDRGIRCAGGLRMLVTQAVYAYRLFTGQSTPGSSGSDNAPVSAKDYEHDDRISALTDRIYQKLYKEKRNIVLTGMPGCGKSTIGRYLSDKLNMDMVDTDELIVKREGRQIPDIFSSKGEEYFRDIESEIIKEVSAKNGILISTGGGAVLREENVRALKSNGIVVFIDRPFEYIIPTDDRPLSSDRDMLRLRYEERYNTYCASCDEHLINDGTVTEAVKKLLSLMEQTKTM